MESVRDNNQIENNNEGGMGNACRQEIENERKRRGKKKTGKRLLNRDRCGCDSDDKPLHHLEGAEGRTATISGKRAKTHEE